MRPQLQVQVALLELTAPELRLLRLVESLLGSLEARVASLEETTIQTDAKLAQLFSKVDSRATGPYLEQFAQQQQLGLEQVRANVKAAPTAGSTQWHEFKSRVDSKETGVTPLDGKEVTFRHKGSGQTYRPDEIVSNFKVQYDAAKARRQAQEAR